MDFGINIFGINRTQQILLKIISFLHYVHNVSQHYSNMTSMLFEDLPALFGSPLPKEGLMVRAENWRKGACRKKTKVKVFYNDVGFFLCVKGSFGGVPPT